ncbi:hypothetical protein [Amycolatopsis sp. NPDC059657]|uniref:hypothetical protein n=1 Tax=Amycolatopsis sp. NPDC059657 TaxID=3346899 RepID=UPI00366AEEDF
MDVAAAPETDVAPDEVPASRRPLVLAGVIGFVIGSGILAVLWGASAASAGAVDDAKAACETLDRMGELPVTISRSQTGLLAPGLVHQVTAARELAAAAAEANKNYQELSNHVDAVSRMVISLHFNETAGHRHLEQAKQICARI